MNTRIIKYIDPEKEDILELEAERAIKMTMEERLREFCENIKVNFAFAGIDVLNYQAKKTIYYIEEGESE